MVRRAPERRRGPSRNTGSGVAAALAGALAVFALGACDGPRGTDRERPLVQATSHLDDRLRVAAGETLPVDRIRRLGGFAYSASIGGAVPGLREGGDGRTLRLVEDGVLLGPAGALSADVVELGGGRYNHETATRILFSASDGSDPRRNGRVYRVEWDEPARVVARSATRSIGLGTTEVVVDVAASRPISSRRLVIENLDPERALRVWGHPAGAPDLTTREAILASVVRPEMRGEEKALALWALMTTWRHHDVAAAAGLEASDPVKLLGVYGFGFCNDVSHALASLLEHAGLRARVVAWDRHSVVEARFDEGWHLLDADLGRVYRTASGRLASVADVFARRATAAFSPTGALPLAAEPFDRVYPRGTNRVHRRALGASGHALRPVLAPGDAAVFDLERGDRFVDRFSTERPPGWPIRFANGTLRRRLAGGSERGCRVARVDWPYPIVAVQISGRGLDPDRPLVAQLRAGEADSWHDLLVERVATDATARARAWVDRGPIRYALEARVCGAGPADLGERAEVLLEVQFQFAPRAVPSIGYGMNTALWTVEDAATPPTKKAPVAAVRVTQEWDELEVTSELAVPPGGVLANLDRSFLAHDRGFAYATPLWQQVPPDHGADLDPRSDAGLVALYENGRLLGPGDATSDEVAASGRGRFLRSGGMLLFSASDGTDPRENGRIYSVLLSPAPAAGRLSSTYSLPFVLGSLPSGVEK